MLHMTDIRSRAWRDGHGISYNESECRVAEAVRAIDSTGALDAVASVVEQMDRSPNSVVPETRRAVLWKLSRSSRHLRDVKPALSTRQVTLSVISGETSHSVWPFLLIAQRDPVSGSGSEPTGYRPFAFTPTERRWPL
jgi:hypothetical protein